MKTDPIIAVKDVNTSVKWCQTVFNCKRTYEEDNFDVLMDKNNEVLLCLHKWEEHEHPTMTNSNIIPGNGLILYYKTENLSKIRENVNTMKYPLEEEIWRKKKRN